MVTHSKYAQKTHYAPNAGLSGGEVYQPSAQNKKAAKNDINAPPPCHICLATHVEGCINGEITHESTIYACHNRFLAIQRLHAEALQRYIPIPQRYATADIAKSEHHNLLAHWIDNTPRNLVIKGPPGTGKTYIAAAIVNHAKTSNRSAVFAPAHSIVRLIRSTFNTEASDLDEDAIISMAALPDILVLDDLGKQSDSDFSDRVIFDIVNERYNSNKITVVTTNLDAADIAKSDRMNAALSRISHDAQIIVCTTNYRTRKEQNQ